MNFIAVCYYGLLLPFAHRCAFVKSSDGRDDLLDSWFVDIASDDAEDVRESVGAPKEDCIATQVG